MHTPPDRDGCAGCSLEPGRRAFLQHTLTLVGGVFATLGISSERADALPLPALSYIHARQVLGTTHVYPIPDKDGVQIDPENTVILVRWLGNMYAFSTACPHQHTTLTWLEKDERFQCPKHRSQYSADGYFIRGRATRGMDRYAITRGKDTGTVMVDVSIVKKQDDDQSGWEATTIKV